MTGCDARDAYLHGSLAADERAAFDVHVSGCDACRAELAAWRTVAAEVRGWAEALAPVEVLAREAAELVRRAGPAPRPRAAWPWALAAAGVVAGAAVLLLAVVDWPGASLTVLRGRPATLAAGAIAAGDEPVLFELGRDRVGLAPESDARVVTARRKDTRLRLVRGTLAVKAAPRAAQERLSVEAAPLVVVVTGTQFSVRRSADGVVVSVTEGTVRVEGAGASREVSAGSVLRFVSGKSRVDAMVERERDEVSGLLGLSVPPADSASPAPTEPETPAVGASPPAPAADFDYERLRSLVAKGDLVPAQRALRRRVAEVPTDVVAWSLLGDALRKSRKIEAAVDAYLRAARHGRGAPAQQARLLAATLLQDDLGASGRAIPLLELYLRSPESTPALRAAALVRLARALAVTGDREGALARLREVVERYPETPAAVEAQELLGRSK